MIATVKITTRGFIMRLWYLNFAASGLLIFSPISLADNDSDFVELPSVIVTQKSDVFNEIPDIFPSQNSTIFSEKDLGIANERMIDDVLTGEKGISIVKPGTQGTGRIYLRGIGGRGLITLDGISLPDAIPNAMNLNMIIPDGLAEMEVTRGFLPASRAFSALGGEIRLTSREATDNSAKLRVEGGTFGYLKETLQSNFATDHARLAVTVNRADTFDGSYQAMPSRGNPERDPFHNTQAMLRAGLDITDNVVWDGSMLYRNSNNAADTGGNKNGIFQQVDDKKSFFIDEGWLAQNTLKVKLSKDWISRLQLGFAKDNLLAEQTAISPSIKTEFYSARWENDQRFWQHGSDTYNVLWGLESRYETASAPLVTRVTATSPPQLSGVFVAKHREQHAVFLDNRFNYGIFSSDFGVRYENYEHYGDHALLHLGTAWQLSQELKLTSNVGNGFRIPSFSELLFPNTGDLNLKPERSVGGDLGLEWQALSNLKLNATGFYSRFNNMIVLAFNPYPPCQVVCMSNIADSTVAGAETGAEIMFNKQWRGGLVYTYTDTENLVNHKEVPFRPNHVARVWSELKLTEIPLTLWSEAVYQSKSQNNLTNTLPIVDTFRINIHADYKVSPEFNLYVRGENLTDNMTPSMYSFYQTGAMVFGGIAVKLW